MINTTIHHFSLLSEALGWTLLHTLWQVTLVAIVLRLLLYSCPTRAARLRYGLSLFALLIVSVWTVFTFIQQWNILENRLIAMEEINFIPTLQEANFSFPTNVETPQVFWEVAIQQIQPYLPFIGLIWILGVFGFSAWMLRAYWQLQHLRKGNVQLPSVEQLQLLETLKAELRILKKVELLFSEKVIEPITFGWLRPVILMPVSVITGLSDVQIEALLLHELAHIRRYDYLVNLFQCCVEILLFYHPAVWWISRKLRAEREHCCDDLVLQIQQQPMHYAEALLQIQINHYSLKTKLAMSANGNKGQLTTRIQRLFGHSSKNNPFTKGALIAFLLVSGLSLFAFYSPEKGVETTSESFLNLKDIIPDVKEKNIVLTFEDGVNKEVHILTDRDLEKEFNVESMIEKNGIDIELDEIKDIQVVRLDGEMKHLSVNKQQLQDIISKEAVENLEGISPEILHLEGSANTYVTLHLDELEAEELPIKINKKGEVVSRGFYDADGKVLEEIFEEKEDLVRKDTLPKKIKLKTLANNDPSKENPLIIVDGRRLESEMDEELDPDDIQEISVIKGKKAIEIYGEDGKNGVIEITTKSKRKKLKKDKEKIKFHKVDDASKEEEGEKLTEIRIVKGEAGTPLYVVDEKRQNSLIEVKKMVERGEISSINVLKGEKAIAAYGEDGKNGVIEITTKKVGEKGSKAETVIIIHEVLNDTIPNTDSSQERYKEELKKSMWLTKIDDIKSSKPSSVRDQFKIYPNPADVQVQIAGVIPKLTKVKIEVLGLNGKLIETLENTTMKGALEVTWNTDKVATGTYLIRIMAGEESFTEKVLIKNK